MRIAVVGSGISGLASAWLLAGADHEVHLLERRERLGGHTHTVTVDLAGGPARSAAPLVREDTGADVGRLPVDQIAAAIGRR